MERTVLVTGAGSGIGLATALRLAAVGFGVVGLVPDEHERAVLSDAAEERGTPVGTVVADLADPAARAAAVGGRDLYALVNNAGLMNAGLLRDVGLDEARSQLETMVVAPVDLARRVVPAMLRRGEGRIVNVTSSAAHFPTPFTGWYTACKAALRQLNDTLRMELAGTGLDVIDIEPGGIATGIWGRAADELRTRRASSTRPGRYARPLAVTEHLSAVMPDPEVVARTMARVLTSGQPRAHQRIGLQGPVARVASEVTPTAVWDRMAASGAGTR